MKKKYQVGFYVFVEMEAYEGEAVIMANAACEWPGDWSPPHKPIEVEGRFNDRITAKAKIIRSQALMVKEVN